MRRVAVAGADLLSHVCSFLLAKTGTIFFLETLAACIPDSAGRIPLALLTGDMPLPLAWVVPWSECVVREKTPVGVVASVCASGARVRSSRGSARLRAAAPALLRIPSRPANLHSRQPTGSGRTPSART